MAGASKIRRSNLIRQRGKAALGVGVDMAKGGNLTKLGQNLDAAMTEIRNALPVGIDFEKVADQPKVVEYAGGEFTRSFVEALSIVLFVSLVSLGLRTGIFVALSAPLVLSFGRAGFKPFASLQPSTASRRSLPSTIGCTPHPVISSATPNPATS